MSLDDAPYLARGEFNGHAFTVDMAQGHLMVEHDGTINWDELAAIKTYVWGPEARAIEVYPADSLIINNVNIRHLWRLGPHDFCPDLTGQDGDEDSLAARHAVAWAEARQ